MKTTLMVLVTGLTLGLAGLARAEEPAADKPDCSEKQKALDEAKTDAKAAGKPDLSSCKELKGKEKADCVKPLKDKAKDDAKAAKDKVKAAKTEADCCKNPKKKGCS